MVVTSTVKHRDLFLEVYSWLEATRSKPQHGQPGLVGRSRKIDFLARRARHCWKMWPIFGSGLGCRILSRAFYWPSPNKCSGITASDTFFQQGGCITCASDLLLYMRFYNFSVWYVILSFYFPFRQKDSLACFLFIIRKIVQDVRRG
jgi:hypothetical protein